MNLNSKTIVGEKTVKLSSAVKILVNVAEIENQVQATEQKLLELDEKLENLPDLRLELVSLYQLEKEERLRKNEHLDFVKERAEENKVLFNRVKAEKSEELVVMKVGRVK